MSNGLDAEFRFWRTFSSLIAAGDPKTNFAILAAVANRFIETYDMVISVSGDTTSPVAVRVGYGVTTIPAATAVGVENILYENPGIAPGTVVYVAPGKSTAVAMALLVTVEDPIAGAVAFSFRARYLAI